MPEAKPLFKDHKNAALVSLQDISCHRGGRVLFQNLTLEVRAGALIHLAGLNGAGKTSLLRIMADQLAPFNGYVIKGTNEVAYLPANDQLLKVLETVEENLSFWCAAQNVEAALKTLGMQAFRDVPVRHLSAGQKRRVSLARIFASKAVLWLLDEPLNALDSDAVKIFWDVIAAHRAKGGAVVIAGHHDVPDAQKITLEALA